MTEGVKTWTPWRFFEIGTVVTLVLAAIGFAYWLGNLNKEVSFNSDDIKELKKNITAAGGVKTRDYSGQTFDMHNRRQFQFMTPSAETWQAKKQFYQDARAASNREPVTLDNFRWQMVTEDKVEEFGRKLIDQGFTQGWRRYPFSGQGRYRDVGWWWVITVNDSFDVDRFVKFYSSYWGTSEIYLEEFETMGDVMPEKFIPHPNLPTKRNAETPEQKR